MDATEKARIEAEELGVSGPPRLEDLEHLALPATLALTGKEAARVWDSGATSGMTKPGSTKGRVETGRTARVFTGVGVVKTNKWVVEDLSWGQVRHTFSLDIR